MLRKKIVQYNLIHNYIAVGILLHAIYMETMQYVDGHFDEPLSLSLLASHCHVSESYLSKQFKLHTGLTLRAYLLDRKIQPREKSTLARAQRNGGLLSVRLQ